MAHPKGILLEELVTREDFAQTYISEYAANKGLEILGRYNIFPLTYKNPKFTYLNLLGAYVYLSGTLHQRGSSFHTMIVRGREQLHGLDDLWGEKLGLSLTGVMPNQLLLGTNGAYYGRLLHVLGFPTTDGPLNGERQRKAKKGTVFPEYLQRILEEYESLSQNAQRTVRKFVSDFVHVWFDTKARISPSLTGRIDLLSQPTEELLEQEAANLIQAIKIAYPTVIIDDERLQKKEYKGRYVGYFVLSTETILSFPLHTWSPVKLSAEIRPRFSTDHPKIKAQS